MKEKFLTFYSSPSARLIGALVLMNTEPIVLISGLRACRLDVPASSSFQPSDFFSKDWSRLLVTPCVFGRERQTSISSLQSRTLCGRLLRYIARCPTISVGNDRCILLIKTNSISVNGGRVITVNNTTRSF